MFFVGGVSPPLRVMMQKGLEQRLLELLQLQSPNVQLLTQRPKAQLQGTPFYFFAPKAETTVTWTHGPNMWCLLEVFVQSQAELSSKSCRYPPKRTNWGPFLPSCGVEVFLSRRCHTQFQHLSEFFLLYPVSRPFHLCSNFEINLVVLRSWTTVWAVMARTAWGKKTQKAHFTSVRQVIGPAIWISGSCTALGSSTQQPAVMLEAGSPLPQFHLCLIFQIWKGSLFGSKRRNQTNTKSNIGFIPTQCVALRRVS